MCCALPLALVQVSQESHKQSGKSISPIGQKLAKARTGQGPKLARSDLASFWPIVSAISLQPVERAAESAVRELLCRGPAGDLQPHALHTVRIEGSQPIDGERHLAAGFRFA